MIVVLGKCVDKSHPFLAKIISDYRIVAVDLKQQSQSFGR